MKKFISILISILIIFMLSVPCFSATEVKVDLEKLSQDARNEILNKNKETAKQEETKIVPTKLEEWSNFGKTFAIALKETCTVLNVEVNNFIKTPVGMMTAGIIFYKFVGKDIVHIFLTFIVFGFLFTCLFFSFYIFHVPKKIVTLSENKVKTISYIQRFDFKSGESRVCSATTHAVIFIIFAITLMAKV